MNSFGVSRESLTRLEILAALVQQWQPHINLISSATLDALWTRHILDSLQLLALFPPHVRAIADLGSGGGFPGLVLAATQHAPVHFYESNGKKCAFLTEALRQMQVAGHVHRMRLGDALPKPPAVDVVTARAFAPLAKLLGYAQPFMRKGTLGLFHKGEDVDAELSEAAKTWQITYERHPSLTDSKSVILMVKEYAHVTRQQP